MQCEFVVMMVMTLEWYVCCTAVKCTKAHKGHVVREAKQKEYIIRYFLTNKKGGAGVMYFCKINRKLASHWFPWIISENKLCDKFSVLTVFCLQDNPQRQVPL